MQCSQAADICSSDNCCLEHSTGCYLQQQKVDDKHHLVSAATTDTDCWVWKLIAEYVVPDMWNDGTNIKMLQDGSTTQLHSAEK